jgi:uncharacterized Fe-S cluster protein YjdI
MSKENREIVKEYSNGEITILWKPKICIHAAECVKRLPNVYKPKEKPWITIENATTEELKVQVEACPSGALSYRMNNADDKEEMHTQTVVEVMENGPLLVYGTLHITNSDGIKEIKNKTTAFCRCGVSANKPYCDGKHREIDFKG